MLQGEAGELGLPGAIGEKVMFHLHVLFPLKSRTSHMASVSLQTSLSKVIAYFMKLGYHQKIHFIPISLQIFFPFKVV